MTSNTSFSLHLWESACLALAYGFVDFFVKEFRRFDPCLLPFKEHARRTFRECWTDVLRAVLCWAWFDLAGRILDLGVQGAFQDGNWEPGTSAA